MMRAVIIASKEALLPVCGEMVVERLIKKLRDYGFDEIYIYPLSYARIIKNPGVKFIGSLKNIKEDVFVIKGNVFLSRLNLCRENIFVGKDGAIIAFYGKPSKNFNKKGKACRVNGFEIKNEEDIRKAEIIVRGKSGDIVYRYIHSKISGPISSRLCSSYLMPWQLFTASFLLSIISLLFYMMPSYLYAVVAGIMAEVSAIVKDTGEEIMSIKEGRWHGIKVLSLFTVLLGASYHAWIDGASFHIWILALLIAMAIAIIQKSGEGYAGEDFFIFVVFVGTLANQLLWAFLIAAVIMNEEAIRRVISSP
ncbi:MAG: hypothetical protein J7L31_05545 [Thermoplasmata archaeon]|nr:hypothetical protein [Thermoplasmata archaeon]